MTKTFIACPLCGNDEYKRQVICETCNKRICPCSIHIDLIPYDELSNRPRASSRANRNGGGSVKYNECGPCYKEREEWENSHKSVSIKRIYNEPRVQGLSSIFPITRR